VGGNVDRTPPEAYALVEGNLTSCPVDLAESSNHQKAFLLVPMIEGKLDFQDEEEVGSRHW